MAGNGLARRGDEDGKRRGKKRALRGGIHPQGSDDYSFFVAPQEKLKSAERKKWFCKNTKFLWHHLLLIAA